MKLVIMTGSGPEHVYVTRALCDAFGSQVAAIVTAEPRRRSLLKRWRRYRRRYSLRQIASRIVVKLYTRLMRRQHRRSQVAARILSQPESHTTLPRPGLRRVFGGYNSADCVRFLDQIHPDVIAVYGTSMISKKVMSHARVAILNMHTGMSPRYRGSNTVFWALHNGEPEWVGATVHILTDGLDAGPVLATARTPIAADDDEHSLFFKTVRVGADAYVGAIRRVMNGTARAVPQNLSLGREYRSVDRTLAAELRVKRMIACGLLRRFSADRQ